MPFIGSIINASTIVIFSVLGSLLKRGIPERINRSVLAAVAICVAYLGIDGALAEAPADAVLPDVIFNADVTKFIIMIVSLSLGTLIGELIDIDKLVGRLGERLEAKFVPKDSDLQSDGVETKGNFARGFISCTIMTSVGAMAVNGAILDATGDPGILIAKSVIDAIACFIMASSLGIGCAFSAIPMFIYQSVLTLAALLFSAVLPSESIYMLSVTGSLIIVLIGTNFLGATKVKTANMMPAIFMPLILTPILNLF